MSRRADTNKSALDKFLLRQKGMPLKITSLFLESPIVYVEISEPEITTRTFLILKRWTTI